jgi:hypothetical protein
MVYSMVYLGTRLGTMIEKGREQISAKSNNVVWESATRGSSRFQNALATPPDTYVTLSTRRP